MARAKTPTIWQLMNFRPACSCRALTSWLQTLELAALKRRGLEAARNRLGEAATRRALLSWHCSAKASVQVAEPYRCSLGVYQGEHR